MIDREICYMRRWLDVPWLKGEGIDMRTMRRRRGIPDSAVADRLFEAQVAKSIALSLLDGVDKAERLDRSDREHPLKSYTGRSEVWKQAIAPDAPQDGPC